ncbi:retrovirus-related Pol polyprotein from transposon 297 [Trichonephila clavipes]|uniref:Retrovirus-related Pol polyprotein from transposon 297 n=1 Tax=Trichonephila clavipes TaxID=2585209 RepID=A0A8X7BAM3_TRICX|nr:retrovirus-related Pol polyprotein from transposon 297 [Trichonephila clavipes]
MKHNCDESVRNLSSFLLRPLFGEYKFAYNSNQLQEDKRDMQSRSGRALDWFEVLGYSVVEDKVTDYAHLNQALTEQFPVVRNSPLGHGSGEIFHIRGGLLEVFFVSTASKDRVVTAQGAPCCHLGRVELQIRIREFQKNSEFHILNNIQYQCILGIDFMKESKLTLDFDQKPLIIPDDQTKQLPKVEKPVEIGLSDTKLGEGQNQKLKDLFNGFKELFSDQPGLTHVLYHEIDTGDKGSVVSRPYRYDGVKQGIIDYHIEKMLRKGKIRPMQTPYASRVVLTRKNNGLPPDFKEAYRFVIGYRKVNIPKYPRYPLPMIDDLITNIPHTGIMSTLDLKSGYFQLAISPKDIKKTTFITRNGTFAFHRMPFGLLRRGAKFSKGHRHYIKPVIKRFVMVYMDGVIITSPSFNEHIDHLNQVFVHC